MELQLKFWDRDSFGCTSSLTRTGGGGNIKSEGTQRDKKVYVKPLSMSIHLKNVPYFNKDSIFKLIVTNLLLLYHYFCMFRK